VVGEKSFDRSNTLEDSDFYFFISVFTFVTIAKNLGRLSGIHRPFRRSGLFLPCSSSLLLRLEVGFFLGLEADFVLDVPTATPASTGFYRRDYFYCYYLFINTGATQGGAKVP